MNEEITTQQEQSPEDYEVDQSRLATVLIAVLLIVGGYLAYSYLFGSNNNTTTTPETTNVAGDQNEQSLPDGETAAQDTSDVLGQINDEGQFVTEDGSQQPVEVPEGATVYTVQPGDSLWTIAESELDDPFLWDEIAAFNNISTESLALEVGQEIALPPVGGPALTDTTGQEEVAEQPAEEEPETTTPEVTLTGETQTYTIQRGDTLWSIAEQFYGDGSKWELLYGHAENDVTMYSAVTTGQTYPLIHAGNTLVVPDIQTD